MGAYAHVLELVGVHGRRDDGDAGVAVLEDIDLVVDAGELVAVMGPSGSGKSSLLRTVSGLVRPSRGKVSVAGTDIAGLDGHGCARMRRRQIGVLSEDPNLLPSLTALENVALPLSLDAVRPRDARAAARLALERVGIADKAGVFPEDLGVEDRQRVAIGRVLAAGCAVLVADEPTGALDSQGSDAVMELLRACVDGGIAGLVATHDPRFAAWADRTLFMRDGRFVDDTGRDRAEGLLEGGPAWLP